MEGFSWLAHLAHWGVSLLADQMGLGKPCRRWLSSQACPWGPTLIVAPTSVCMNWVSEALRPSISFNLVGAIANNYNNYNRLICWYAATVCCSRKKCPKCCPRCSGKRLCWTKPTIKKTTKRSQAMNLKGGFKLITTGTPMRITSANCGICSYQSWVHLKASINALLSQLRSFRINRYAAN